MRAKYILSEVAVGLWRNVTMTIAMIMTMAVSLTMLGASILLYQQVGQMKDFYYSEVQVSIFLSNSITDDERTELGDELRADPLVKSVVFESRHEAYQKFAQNFAEAPDLVRSTKEDALPESYRVKLKDVNQYQAIYDKYHDKTYIDDIVDQRKLVSKLFDIVGAVQNIAFVVAIVQGVAALLLVANTIQVAAYSKRREVAVMKLVGASNWFIQAPFVLEAVFAGLIGSILAFVAIFLGKSFIVDGSLSSLAKVLTPVHMKNVWLLLPELMGISALISAVTGWFTLRFYLRV
jgi:cell division transport system permease protein